MVTVSTDVSVRSTFELYESFQTSLIPCISTIALAFAWIERLLLSPSKDISVATALSLLDSSLDVLKAAGFQDLVFEDFYDVLVNLIRHIVVPGPDGQILTSATLLQAFQDPESESVEVHWNVDFMMEY